MKLVEFGEPTSFLDHVYLGCTRRECKPNELIVTTSWICKKQTSVSHSSTESEAVYLDAGLRMEGILAFDLWDLVTAVLDSSKTVSAPGNRSRDEIQSKHTNTKTKRHNNR